MSDDELQYQVSMEHLWAHDRELISTLKARIEELEREADMMYVLACTVKDRLKAKLAKAGIDALETILNERGPVFDAMVDAAEDAAGKDVSFNVVVGRAIRAALAVLAIYKYK